MSPIIFWMLGISFSAAFSTLAVAFDVRSLLLLISFIMVGFIALAGVRDQRMIQDVGGYPSHRTATIVRHMGLMYGWAAVIIALIYSTLLEWQLWFAAFFVTVIGATLCVFLANILMRDLSDAAVDSRMIQLVRTIAKAQLAATCICFGGLIVVGLGLEGAMGGRGSWAAVSVLISTSLGLAALSGFLILFPAGMEPEAEQQPDMPVQIDRRKTDRRQSDIPVVNDRRRKQQRAFGKARPA